MPKPDDPLRRPERSIYEKLGLATTPRPPRRSPNASRPNRPSRMMLGIFALLGGILLVYAVSGGTGVRHIVAMPASEDQRRMDTQQAQITALEQRIEMLEIRVRALQQMPGYQTLDGRRLPNIPDPLADKKPSIDR